RCDITLTVTDTLSLHDALPILHRRGTGDSRRSGTRLAHTAPGGREIPASWRLQVFGWVRCLPKLLRLGLRQIIDDCASCDRVLPEPSLLHFKRMRHRS